MRVEFLGTAGYHPSETRHTTGVFVPDAGADDAFLLDAGSGTFRLIGRELPARLHVFMSHAHLDHTVGLSFLYNVFWVQRHNYRRDLHFTFYGDAKTRDTVREKLFSPLLFPLEWSWNWRLIEAGAPFEVAGAKINTAALTHPGGSLGYRFDWEGHALGFITDTSRDESYFPLIEGVDLLIHERNFPDPFVGFAVDSGHCTSSDLIEAACASKAPQIAAMHFNPLTQDDPLQSDNVYQRHPGIVAAHDGLTLDF